MSDLSKQYPPGQEKATAVRAGTSDDAVVPKPNSASDADVPIAGTEGGRVYPGGASGANQAV